MDSHRLPHDDSTRLDNDVQLQALAYKWALYDFADGLIPWSELLKRHRAIRLALRIRRRERAA